jgi:hypothetical protein
MDRIAPLHETGILSSCRKTGEQAEENENADEALKIDAILLQ